jgi:molybdopterin synthase sulfur carrier subunit
MPTVHLPAALRAYADGQRLLAVGLAGEPATVAGVLEALGRDHPGVRQRVLDERGDLRRHVNVFVNGESVRFLDGLATPVGDRDEVWIIPSISGGSARAPG